MSCSHEKPDYKEFHGHVPSAVTRAIVETAGNKFQSIGFEGGRVAELGLACYKCVGQAMNDDEMHFVSARTNKLTSDWMRTMKIASFSQALNKQIGRLREL